jgi:hypothetical protein
MAGPCSGRHAAHDAHHQAGVALLQGLELSELGEDLLLRLLTNGAGVDQDEVGDAHVVRQLVLLLAEQTGHALRVILVHLTAVRDEMKFRHACAKNLLSCWLDRSTHPQ